MIYLDTNTLVRFFTKDDQQKANKVAKLLQTEKDIRITDVVFPEIEYVLKNVYEASRAEITKAFQFILALPNVKLSKSIRKAFTLYAKINIDMADCIIATSSYKGKLASFDHDLLKTPEIKSYW